ncbi:MAG: flavin reductase family protein [Thermoproteales archaeon]|nr:flavin reductase family protein [Thermoproteales archaeon]
MCGEMLEVMDKFYLLLHPRPAYIIGAGRFDEVVNFMAASWVTPVSEEPPRVVVAVGVDSFTNELIKKYREFTVNIYPIERIDDVYFLGSTSGWEINKVEKLGLKVGEGEKVKAPVLLDSLAFLECKLVLEVESGDTTIFIGEVVNVKASKEAFSMRKGWRIPGVNIPLHNWGRGFYTVGKFLMARRST